jgi:AcrR family transcriptional regulator
MYHPYRIDREQLSSMTPDPRPDRPYHHGNLRAELIEASFDLLAEHGLAGFSVAKLARAVGVSTASPYRHFADRAHLLTAVAAQAALELADRIRIDVESAGPDPIEQFAVTAGTYVRYVAERGAGFNVIFSAPLTQLEQTELSEAGRQLISLLLDLAQRAGDAPGREQARALLERHIVTAHGYVTLYRDGFFTTGNPTVQAIAERATQASRALLRRDGTHSPT